VQAFENGQPFDATSALDSPNACVPHRVEAQAAWGPDDVAVSDGTQHLTRGALENAANRLARRLRSLGVRRDVPVGLCLPRSLELVVGALGIIKAGGAYVPMDPGYPPERLAFMLEDTAAPVLVTTPSLARRLPRGTWTVVDIKAQPMDQAAAEAPPAEINGSDLAYIIYTSGSTGTPKGVEITHASLANLVSWHLDAFSVTSCDRASHLAGLGFDA